LNQVVIEALDGWTGMPDVELTRELEPLPAILADREQMRERRHQPGAQRAGRAGPGRLDPRSHGAPGGSVVLSVADNGCGMSEAFVKTRCSARFRAPRRSGLGIGMFQSRMIVEAHGGSIRVESEPGKGSTFRVSLPVKERK
jgi:signal transduction histidine kinase